MDKSYINKESFTLRIIIQNLVH